MSRLFVTIGALFPDRLWASSQGGRRDPLPSSRWLGGGSHVMFGMVRWAGMSWLVGCGLDRATMVILRISISSAWGCSWSGSVHNLPDAARFC